MFRNLWIWSVIYHILQFFLCRVKFISHKADVSDTVCYNRISCCLLFTNELHVESAILKLRLVMSRKPIALLCKNLRCCSGVYLWTSTRMVMGSVSSTNRINKGLSWKWDNTV